MRGVRVVGPVLLAVVLTACWDQAGFDAGADVAVVAFRAS